jgi:glycosyltransferase involved in cell wall biosynthesis
MATLSTDLAIAAGRIIGKKIFLTDLGGSADLSLWHHFPLRMGVHAFLAISEFSRFTQQGLPMKKHIIYGGVDTTRFCPGRQRRTRRVLFVGRILTHKGIHHLIGALPPGAGLDIVGPPYDRAYFQELKERALGKDVLFYTDLMDDALVGKYQTAMATVLPSEQGTELLGLTLLESMACQTPVICSNTGGMPEVVKDNITGFIVPPGSPETIRRKIEYLLGHPEVVEEMGKRGREEILKRFTWDAVAERCLQAYAA